MKTRIIIFAKAPVAGLAKTRLIPALGAEGAARLARRMLVHAIGEALAAGADRVELCVTPSGSDPAWGDFQIPSQLDLTTQCEGDLGQRLAQAAEHAVLRGEAVILMGTDCPSLNSAQLQDSIKILRDHDAVMIPALDGGYVLLGCKKYHALLFAGIPWSTASVASETAARMHALGWNFASSAPLHDIDEADDLQWLPANFFEPD